MRFFAAFFAIFLLATACKEPFLPEVDPEKKDLLVVEGHLNIGGITTFDLSRTIDLTENESRRPERNARVLIEEAEGVVVQAISDLNGRCVLNTEALSISKKYRVRIIRANGSVYETDFLENKVTPSIDSIGFRIENNGFELYLNTSDETKSTRFYSWRYSETWEIRSSFTSSWELKNGKIVERDPDADIYRCWQGNSSNNILLSSTERLAEDRISSFPLTFVQGNSIKLSNLYSIMVTQYGLTREAYQYLETMKKNTETIGTIFDPQPSELQGNIKSVSNPKELVVGWISAGTITEKRIFIKSSERPRGWGYRELCEPVMTIHTDSILLYLAKDFLINRREYFPPPPPLYDVPPPWKYGDTIYTIAPKRCVDCTLRGSNVKPPYWPN